MGDWHPTPDDERLKAQRYVDGAWERGTVEYRDLKPGDIFRAIDPFGAVDLVAWTWPVARVTAPPVKAYAHDGLQGYGWAVEVDGYESLRQALSAS